MSSNHSHTKDHAGTTESAETAETLFGLPALCSANTRLIVLGSFPSVRSLQAQQYYAHPQNHFWRILGAAWGIDLPKLPYAERCACLLQHGLGLWDVYASCQRQGSLDSAIRHATANNLAQLQAACPLLKAFAHNGGESWRHHRHSAALGLPVHRLPSSSPANARWSFEQKLQAWREVLALYGLCKA